MNVTSQPAQAARRVLVTGVTGYVGGRLLRTLSHQNQRRAQS